MGLVLPLIQLYYMVHHPFRYVYLLIILAIWQVKPPLLISRLNWIVLKVYL